MDNHPLFPAYEKLWQHARDEGVRVFYNGLATDEGGQFAHEGFFGTGKPAISITRKGYREPNYEASDVLNDGTPVDIEAELFVLAHEWGHCDSWRDSTTGARWEERFAARLRLDAVIAEHGWAPAAIAKGFSRNDMDLVLEEETTAWDRGRSFIPSEAQNAYDRAKELGLHRYRVRFGLEELRPGET